MEFDEVLSSPGFYILNVVGFVAIIIMLVVLKGMGNGDIMPTWVKLVTFAVIPIASFIFTIIFGE